MRGLFDGAYIFDTTDARYVWEHPYYPQFWIPKSALKASLKHNEAVDDGESAHLATLKGDTKSTDRILIFAKGPLADLVRLEFSALGIELPFQLDIYSCMKRCVV